MYKSCIYYQISVWSLFTDFPEWKIRPTCLYIPRPLISDWSYLCQLSFLCYCGRFKLHNTPMRNSLVMLCLRSLRIHGTISIKSWWSVKSLHLHSKVEITPRNSVMICRVAWPEKYVGFSAFTVFLIVYVEGILQSTKGKGIMTFSGILSVPRFTDSITQHAAGCSVHPWAPHHVWPAFSPWLLPHGTRRKMV